MLRCAAGEHKQYLVRATYLEIYQEEVRDLLSKNPNQRLDVKETPDKGVYVKGLVQFVVKSVAEINSVLQVQSAAYVSAALAYQKCLTRHIESSRHGLSMSASSASWLVLARIAAGFDVRPWW